MEAGRGDDTATFVVEVMGFQRASYLEGKERTHLRMAELGTLCTIDATRFRDDSYRVTEQGRRVTDTLRRALRER